MQLSSVMMWQVLWIGGGHLGAINDINSYDVAGGGWVGVLSIDMAGDGHSLVTVWLGICSNVHGRVQ